MNNPIPNPPKPTASRNQKTAGEHKKERRRSIINDLQKKAKKSKKLITYICTIPEKGKLVQVEIRAVELLDVGKLCHDKYGEYPLKVEKKPFEMPQHLTQRLDDHEGLRELAKSLNREAGRK